MSGGADSPRAAGGAAPRAAGRQNHAALLHNCQRRFARMLTVAFGVTAACNLTVLLVPIYSMRLYDTVLTTMNLQTLLWLTIALCLALSLYGALEYARSRLYDVMAGSIAQDLGLPSLLAAAHAADRDHQAMPGQAMRDLSELRGFLSGNAINTPLDLFWTPFIVLTLLVFHWGYAVYGLLCALVLLGLNLLTSALTRRALEEANDHKLRSFAEIAVAVRNAETVEGLGMLPALSARWRSSQSMMLAKLWQGTRTMKLVGAIVKAGRFLMNGGVVCVGFILTLQGEVSAGTLLASSLLMGRLLAPFEQVSSSWRSWVSAEMAWRRVKTLLLEAKPMRGTFPLPCPEGRITVDRLVYIPRGHDQPVLRGISFAVEPGEVVGVIGPSGAGKSTLARLIVGIDEPTAGGVWLDGNSTWLWERGDFGRHVGYMPQTTALLDATIAENIARLRETDHTPVVAAAMRAGIHEAIMRLPNGYATRLSDGGFVLSGGQRQRLALARALFGQPRLLVLDEPNSNLDSEGERILIEAVRRARADGTTVIMIAHRPSLMAVADKLLVLRDGVIERFGGRDGVMRLLQAAPMKLVRSGEPEAPRARLAAR